MEIYQDCGPFACMTKPAGEGGVFHVAIQS